MANIFEQLRVEGMDLPKLFAEFIVAINDIGESRMEDMDNSAEYREEASESIYDEAQEILSGEEDKEYGLTSDDSMSDCAPMFPDEDFPGRPVLCWTSIPDEASFYGGREVGIPESVAVHSSPYQGRLLPIQNGLFIDRSGY